MCMTRDEMTRELERLYQVWRDLDTDLDNIDQQRRVTVDAIRRNRQLAEVMRIKLERLES